MNANGNFPTYEQQQQALMLLQELGVDIDTLLAGRVVKSVQRGYLNGAATLPVITISAVNTSKTIVLLDGVVATGSGNTTLPNLLSMTETSISLNTLSSNGAISWQVIEFY